MAVVGLLDKRLSELDIGHGEERTPRVRPAGCQSPLFNGAGVDKSSDR
jgi:hypothetical protein